MWGPTCERQHCVKKNKYKKTYVGVILMLSHNDDKHSSSDCCAAAFKLGFEQFQSLLKPSAEEMRFWLCQSFISHLQLPFFFCFFVVQVAEPFPANVFHMISCAVWLLCGIVCTDQCAFLRVSRRTSVAAQKFPFPHLIRNRSHFGEMSELYTSETLLRRKKGTSDLISAENENGNSHVISFGCFVTLGVLTWISLFW